MLYYIHICCLHAYLQVTVAKSFDAPIKLLFPRALDLAAAKAPFSMLGLGDIVIPGIFVAIVLRYDAKQSPRSKYFYRCCHLRKLILEHSFVVTLPSADIDSARWV